MGMPTPQLSWRFPDLFLSYDGVASFRLHSSLYLEQIRSCPLSRLDGMIQLLPLLAAGSSTAAEAATASIDTATNTATNSSAISGVVSLCLACRARVSVGVGGVLRSHSVGRLSAPTQKLLPPPIRPPTLPPTSAQPAESSLSLDCRAKVSVAVGGATVATGSSMDSFGDTVAIGTSTATEAAATIDTATITNVVPYTSAAGTVVSLSRLPCLSQCRHGWTVVEPLSLPALEAATATDTTTHSTTDISTAGVVSFLLIRLSCLSQCRRQWPVVKPL